MLRGELTPLMRSCLRRLEMMANRKVSNRDASVETRLEFAAIPGGTSLADVAAMARRRAQHAPVALASNGLMLVNVFGLLEPKVAEKVRAALPKAYGADWFLGVPLADADSNSVLERVDDAAAEAVAKTSMATRSTKTRR
jgi:hypothetical protein